jgi:hypothetical protein
MSGLAVSMVLISGKHIPARAPHQPHQHSRNYTKYKHPNRFIPGPQGIRDNSTQPQDRACRSRTSRARFQVARAWSVAFVLAL